jgi:Flp pilus assembly protein CpaB
VTKGRWLVLVLLLILAALATAGVYLYSRGVDYLPKETAPMGMVVVSEVDIPAKTDLNKLIKHDQFKIIQVPEVAVVDGAVTSVDQLMDRRTRVRILAGEQILASRIKGG